MKNGIQENTVVIYQAKSGALELRTDTKRETFWLTQLQVAEIFDVKKAAISKHVKNIFDSRELSKKATVSKMETVQIEGNREVLRSVEHYNLDLILSVGYRVNSKKATRFRQWATKTLRQHIIEGFTINKGRIASHYQQFFEAVNQLKTLLPEGAPIDNASVIELVNFFADTWLSLEAYDRDALVTKGATKRSVDLTAEKLLVKLAGLKELLLSKSQATDIFGVEREAGSVAGIIGNVMQSFDGRDFYETAEEKAAHLLYFMVKNHPFIDGNKRNGAYAFVWFLREARILNPARLTPPALTALTILVAESKPRDKDKIIRLILTLLLGHRE